jgi:hypothetical protein
VTHDPYADDAGWTERAPTWVAVARTGDDARTVLLGGPGGGLGHAVVPGTAAPDEEGSGIDDALAGLRVERTGDWSFDGVEWRAAVRPLG